MYGAVLYVVGPLVLALYPALGVGQLARTFMVNLLVWNAWGIIYAIISQLLTIMSANSLANIFTNQSFGGAFQGASQMLLISLSSILLSIMILLIPFIAKRVISGDVGSTMLAVAGVAAAAVQTAVAGWAGVQAGAGSGGGGGDHPPTPPPPGGPPPPPPPGGGASAGGIGAGATAASDLAESGAGASSAPRPLSGAADEAGGSLAAQPANASRSSGGPGHFGRYSIPHAVGWTVGTWAGATQRTVSGAFRSSQKAGEEEG
jgi:hypothetical protein